LIWLKTIEKANASLINLDKNGDIFVSGSFRSNVDFDPGPGQFILPHSGVLKSDFLLKLDKHGNFIWVINVVRGSNVSHIYDFYFDINEDIILTGSIRSPADFDPGPGIFELSGLWDRTSSFVSKLDKIVISNG